MHPIHKEAYQFEKQGDHKLERPFARQDKLKEPLYVVTPVFNAARWRSRWKLYADFKKMVAEAGAILYTVEVAFGDREFVVTSPDDPHNLQLRTFHELWLKEPAINLVVQRLPRDWTKVAWVDADCHFARYDWADETKHLLEHYPVIQMWSQLHDLDASHELIGSNISFADYWLKNGPYPQTKTQCDYPYPYHAKQRYPGAPGLAWAMRREAWDQLGGLIDYCILGAGDWYMAHALTGQLDRVIRPDQMRLGEKMKEWENRARNSLWQERPIMGNLGVMPGICWHYFHGFKSNRLYGSREKILSRNDFDPDLDLKRDWQGLYQLTNRKQQLRRDLQWYTKIRNEDQT
jgi:hypothetical protein